MFQNDQVISNKNFNTLKTFLAKKSGRRLRQEGGFDGPDEGVVAAVAKLCREGVCASTSDVMRKGTDACVYLGKGWR